MRKKQGKIRGGRGWGGDNNGFLKNIYPCPTVLPVNWSDHENDDNASLFDDMNNQTGREIQINDKLF